MTFQKAQEVLAGPLVFGNAEQIAAVHHIERLEKAVDALIKAKAHICTACEGSGEHMCRCGDEHECRECEARGVVGGNSVDALAEASGFSTQDLWEVATRRGYRL